MDALTPGDRRLEHLDLRLVERRLEEQDEEVAGVSLGLLVERVARDDVLPFLRGADVEVGPALQARLDQFFTQWFDTVYPAGGGANKLGNARPLMS